MALPTLKDFPYRIAIICDGASNYVLDSFLSKTGIMKNACLILTIDELDNGELAAFDPCICLLLGKGALYAAKGIDKLDSWRGSLFLGEREPFLGRKCIASHHPNKCIAQYELSPLVAFDIKKAFNESKHKELHLTQHNLVSKITADEVCYRLQQLLIDKPLIAMDIEGVIDHMSCLSIATPDESFIVPFSTFGGGNYWDNEDDELRIWKLLVSVLEDPTIPKALQNSLYDRFVIQYSYHITVQGVIDDTMLKHWELYCELEKGLGFLCSLYTSTPFYKGDRKSDDQDTFFRYCCKDSAVTLEINTKLETYLNAVAKQHYKFNIELLNPILYMELRGIKYDEALAKQRLVEVDHNINTLQFELDTLAGCDIALKSRFELIHLTRDTLCYKKDQLKPKAPYVEDYNNLIEILNKPNDLTAAEYGYIASVLKLGMNLKSITFKTFLYDTLNCPRQIDHKTEALTTNYEALLKIKKALSKKATQDSRTNRVLDLAIEIGSLRTRSQMLHISADKDGRIRCGYNVVGTETGRLTCYTSPTGSGYNLQTIPSTDKLKPDGHPLKVGMRDLFVADEGYYIFQCDLSGADGWTVAAHLASLGDPTMLDDYRAGIKPAKVLCYLMRHGAASLQGKCRVEIKHLTGPIKGSDWDYFASKIGQHGSCYLMGPQTMANHLFIQSEGKVTLSQAETKELQQLFFVRYRVKLWHEWMSRHLSRQNYPPTLTSASGFTRKFFGRHTEILGQALAHEPQANTTYATNLAAWGLWTDKENRTPKGLRIEPLHQVHDAILGQFAMADTPWAVERIKGYFNNSITIAGIPITIPFEGNYGTSWGDLSVGSI